MAALTLSSPRSLLRATQQHQAATGARRQAGTRRSVCKACSSVEGVASELLPPAEQASRRACLLQASAAAALLPAAAAFADEEAPALATFEDAADGFSLSIPAGWTAGEGVIGGGDGGVAPAATRRALAWFPGADAADVNVTLVITNASADYTSLGSFGSADDFASNLVNSMDRSDILRGPKWARKGIKDEDVQVARLLDSRGLNGGYQIEYTVQNGVINKRHLLSFVILGFNGRYNRLYTITAQCPEAELPKYDAIFHEICQSFKAPLLSDSARGQRLS